MRKYIAICILAIVSCASSFAQNFDDEFEAISNMKGVSSVYISKAMLRLINVTPELKKEGVDVSKVAGKLSCIQILDTDNAEAIAAIKHMTRNVSQKGGFEELMRVKDDDDNMHIYMKTSSKGEDNIFMLLNDGKTEMSVICIVGTISLEEIQSIVNN